MVSSVRHYLFRSLRIVADVFTNLIGLVYFSKRGYLPSIDNGILLDSAVELSEKIRSGKLKCVDVMRAYIERIKLVQPHINALCTERFDDAIQEAINYDEKIQLELNGKRSDRDNTDDCKSSVLSLPLLGVPFTVKDSIAMKGMSFTAGLYARKGVVSDEDSQVVINMRRAGAIPVGVTNVPEFLLWWDSSNNIYGRTNNPYDKSHISGGSSGGEAALISSGGSICGIGTDIGGSIRIPAFCCGVFGHKPTPDIVPTSGMFPLVDHPERQKLLSFGPICRYSCDLKPLLTAAAGNNSHLLSFDKKVDISKLKFYYMDCDPDPLKTPISDDMANAMQRVTHHLHQLTDSPCHKIEMRKMKHSFFIWLCALSNMDSPTLAEELAERKGKIGGWNEMMKWCVGKSHFRFPTLVNLIVEGLVEPEKIRSSEKFQRMISIGEKVKEELYGILGEDGVLIYPTQPECAPKHNGTILKAINCAYTAIFNVLQLPVTQVPLGLNKDGLPVGVQVIAGPFKDHLTIAVAEELERQFGGWIAPCPVECKSMQWLD